MGHFIQDYVSFDDIGETKSGNVLSCPHWRGPQCLTQATMSAAIEKIVESYVKLGNRIAVEEMLDHRQRLLQQARLRDWNIYNPESYILILEREIEALTWIRR